MTDEEARKIIEAECEAIPLGQVLKWSREVVSSQLDYVRTGDLNPLFHNCIKLQIALRAFDAERGGKS